MPVLRLIRAFALALSLLVVTACGSGEASNDQAAQAVCAPIAPTECLESAPHYPDVAPIFARRCASCHTGIGDAPWPLDNYEHVVDWASFIRDELLRCSMPPSDSDVSMKPDERDEILVWLRCGYPK